jgi:P-type Ca2+ transporter type 2C
MAATKHYHYLSIDEVFELLNTNNQWLSKTEAKARLDRFWHNKLPESKRFSMLTIFLAQFKNPLIYILFFALIISFVTGHYADGWIILFVTMISTVVWFLQEYKANTALNQLKSLITFKAKVMRDWVEMIVPQEELIPWDLIIMSPWDKVPADARLIEIQNFEVIESALTGESLPIEKHIEIIDKESAMADRKNMVYLWTVVSRWTAKAIITATWTHTEIGHIAKLVHDVEEWATPLQKQILHFGKAIWVILIVLNIIVFGLGILMWKPIFEMFLTSVSMVVAAVPEWLLPAMTIILAVWMQKLAKQKGLVRKMLATETLGAVSVICSDKTWTLTQGEMRVVEIITEASEEEVLKIGLLCNDAFVENPHEDISNWKIIGNPTEKALLLAWHSAWFKKHLLESTTPRKSAIPFESQHKYMVTHHALCKIIQL